MEFTYKDIEEACVQAIRVYLNKTISEEEVRKKHRIALLVMMEEVEEILSNKKTGILSIAQGSQSITFDNSMQVFEVSNNVKALLPKPNINLI